MNAQTQTSVVLPTAVELTCIDLLARHGNTIDQLAQPGENRNERAMIDGAIEIVSCFLDFADKHYDDRSSFALATQVIEIVERATELKHDFAQLDTWFRGSRKSELEIRQNYELLGEVIVSFCHDQYATCVTMFRPGSPHQQHFRESSESFLKELKERW